MNEYLKAVDNLTIDPTLRLKRKIKVLEGREEIAILQRKYDELRSILSEKQIEDITDLLLG